MYKQNLNTMKKIFGLVAVAAIAALNVCVAVNSYSSDLKKFLSENESLAGIRYYYYNGEVVPVGDLNKNWKGYPVLVTCTINLYFVSESYNVEMEKCGLGEGECRISDICLTTYF